MRISPVVCDLHDDAPSARMHLLYHHSPALDLSLRVDARSGRITLCLCIDCRAFRDDERCRRPLRVVLRIERCRNVAGTSPHSGHGSHDDSVWQFESAKLQGCKERFCSHGFRFVLTKADFADLNVDQKRLFHNLIVAFIRINPPLHGEENAGDITTVRGEV